MIAWTSKWLFPSSALDSTFTLTGGNHFLFCYKTVKQKACQHCQCAAKVLPLPWPRRPLRTAGAGERDVRSPLGRNADWGRPVCVALPGMALPRRGFHHTSFLSLFPPRFSPLNLKDWLSPSPEQCFQRTFQWVMGNGPTIGEKAAKGAFPVLCTSPQGRSGLCTVSFPYVPK